MRSVLTEISSKLFGLSVLIFVLALLIPFLEDWLPLAENSETAVHEPAGSAKKTNKGLEPERTQNAATNDGLQASIAPLQREVRQSQANGLNESAQNAGLVQEHPQSPIGDEEQPPVTQLQDEVAQKQSNQSSQNEGLEQERPQSPAIDNGSQPPITQTQGEASQNPANRLTASTSPVGNSGIPSPDNERKQSSPHEPISLLVLGGNFFLSGQATPNADIQREIDKIIPVIKTQALDNVVVEGHADRWVPDGVSPVLISKLNQSISLRRANAIAQMLRQKGIASDRIIVHGLGDAVPLASNLTYEGRAKNRRVEVKLLSAQQ
jgi:outer membrane protein OmpA-like peptidoglycan-associated protein